MPERKEIISFNMTSELVARIRAIPENLRSIQIEELLRPQVGLPPRLAAYRDPPQARSDNGERSP